MTEADGRLVTDPPAVEETSIVDDPYVDVGSWEEAESLIVGRPGRGSLSRELK